MLDHCKFFEEQGGFDKLEKFVDGKIERHQKLVTIIKQNIDAWKNQTTQYIGGKFFCFQIT